MSLDIFFKKATAFHEQVDERGSDLDSVLCSRCLVNAALAHRVGTYANGLLHHVAVTKLVVLTMQLLEVRLSTKRRGGGEFRLLQWAKLPMLTEAHKGLLSL